MGQNNIKSYKATDKTKCLENITKEVQIFY
jgi:hypothetical protein